MSFQLSYSKEKRITINAAIEDYAEVLFNNVESKVKQASIKDIDRKKRKLTFDGSIFRFSWNGFNLFNGISSGKMRIDQEDKEVTFSYEIFFTEYFFIALAFTIIPIAFYKEPMMAFSLFFIIWGLVFAGSCWFTTLRFNKLVKKTIIETNIHFKNGPSFG